MGHPKVLEAAVIAVPHPQLGGAPAGLRRAQARVQGPARRRRRSSSTSRPRVAKWWLPDDVVFIDAVPKTSVGKFDKKVLRERFKDWKPAD